MTMAPPHPAPDRLDGLEPVTIDTATGPLTYLRGGALGPPMILLNALGQGLDPWTRLLALLAPRRVLAWEMRRTDAAGRPLVLDEHADDLAAIRAHEGAAACHLVGWCTGAKVALAHCLRGGGGTRSMTFLSGAFKHPARRPELDTTYERNLEAVCRAVELKPAAAARLMRLLAHNPHGADGAAEGLAPPMLAAAVRKPFESAEAFVVYALQHMDFWSRDPLPAAAGLDVPMLFVGCEQDVIVSPEGVRAAADGVPSAGYVELGAATHYALFERAEDVAVLIERFVGDHGR